MATDPVKQVRHDRFQDPFVGNLPAVLKRLANLPPSTGAPYLTLTLDWRPDGTRPEVRTGKKFFDEQMDNFFRATGFEAHTPPYESLSSDIERVRSYVDGDVDPAVQGIVFIACAAQNVFDYLPLGLPLSNHAALAPTPELRVLAKLAEDEPPYAVLLADQKHAIFSVIDQAMRERDINVKATGFPRHQKQGGLSQRRYQARAEDRVEAFVRAVAVDTQRAMKEAAADLLVLAGNDQITAMFRGALHLSVSDRIAGTVRLDVNANEDEVIAESVPVIEQWEREHEAAMVDRVENGAGPGGGAVTGPVETLTALQARQVMALVMNDDFAMPGWADFSFPLYGVGAPPSQHPAGGDVSNIVPVTLENELVRLAIQEDAETEIVHATPPVTATETVDEVDGAFPRTSAARRLDALGGVGGILRFALAADQSTAAL